MKRTIDILFSLIGIIVIFPLLPILGMLIKLDSKGPVFYKTSRVGKDKQIFKMYKFRTMFDTPVKLGESVCARNDPRVTFFGRFLRRTKMNELPQLFNILKGDMTFVGPRPEAPDLAELYPEEGKRIFSVKPGLVGPSTIIMRNEEECYPPGVDTKKFYIEHILPGKLNLDLAYINNSTLFKDIKFILAGVKETLHGAISKKHLIDNRSQIYLFIADFCLTVTSYLFACSIKALIIDSENYFLQLIPDLAILVSIRLGCNVYFGLYSSIIRYISYYEIWAVLKSVTCSSLVIVFVSYLFELKDYSNLITAIDWVTLIFLLSCLRWSLRFYWEKKRGDKSKGIKHRILIYGAGDAGYRALKTIKYNNKYSPFEVIGFIDDNPDVYGKALNGQKVLGNRYHLKALAKLYRASEIIITEQEANQDNLLEVIKICRNADLRCRILTSYNGINGMGLADRAKLLIRNVEFSDILPLKHIQSDHTAVKKVIGGKTILVNSSGGALGLELCRKLLYLGCARLIIADRYESYLNETVTALLNNVNYSKIIPVLINANETQMIERVFKHYHPDIVIHGGMRKYKPVFDVQLEKICQTYYRYTLNLAKLAKTHRCELFIMISSLIAAEGGDVISELLRKAEVYLRQFFRNTNTCLVISRLCDIAENRGNIISYLEEQIVDHGKVILPSEKTNCCLITKYSAAEFVLQNIVEKKNKLTDKCIFICNDGSTISLFDLTRRLAGYHGMNLRTDIEINYIGKSDEGLNIESSLNKAGILKYQQLVCE